jgi:hypothetical protein
MGKRLLANLEYDLLKGADGFGISKFVIKDIDPELTKPYIEKEIHAIRVYEDRPGKFVLVIITEEDGFIVDKYINLKFLNEAPIGAYLSDNFKPIVYNKYSMCDKIARYEDNKFSYFSYIHINDYGIMTQLDYDDNSILVVEDYRGDTIITEFERDPKVDIHIFDRYRSRNLISGNYIISNYYDENNDKCKAIINNFNDYIEVTENDLDNNLYIGLDPRYKLHYLSYIISRYNDFIHENKRQVKFSTDNTDTRYSFEIIIDSLFPQQSLKGNYITASIAEDGSDKKYIAISLYRDEEGDENE